MRGEDDEVALFLLRNLGDFLPCAPEADNVAGFDIGAASEVAQFLDHLLAFLRCEVGCSKRRIHPVAGINHLLHNMNERDLRTELRRKAECIAKRLLRVVRKIHRHEDALNFKLERSKGGSRRGGFPMPRTVSDDKLGCAGSASGFESFHNARNIPRVSSSGYPWLGGAVPFLAMSGWQSRRCKCQV